MNRAPASLVFALTLLVAISGFCSAQDFSKGVEAEQNGDFETAIREWYPLAEQGDSRAQNNLAVMYFNGYGVAQNYIEAAKWYRKASEQGAAVAQNNLGLMYAKGNGVPQDNTYAYMWLTIAGSNGFAAALHNRDIVAKRMTARGVSKAQSLALECMKKNYKGC